MTITNTPVLCGSVYIAAGDKDLRDNGDGTLVGDGVGSVNYETGYIWAGFTEAPSAGDNILVRYYH